MTNENDIRPEEFDDYPAEEEVETPKTLAPRARNKTVMLSSDVTGEIRGRFGVTPPELAHDSAEAEDDGFVSPLVQRAATGLSSRAAQLPEPELPPVAPPVLPQRRVAPPPSTAYQVPSSRSLASPTPPAPPPVAPRAAAPTAEGVYWLKPAPIAGFLVSFDKNPNGSAFELRSGRLIVSSEPAPNGNYLLIEDESVSPMHAILRISALGEIQVLDQLSEFGTKIKRLGSAEEEELSGDKSSLEHGDIIRFGERSFSVCLVQREEE